MKHNHKKFINQLIFSMMTKKILGLIFLFLVISATKTTEAQTYRPMLQDSVRWIVVWDDINTLYGDDDRWEYFAQGDTLVENILYKKIYHRFLESKYGKQPPFQAVSPYVLFGLMREDTLTRQVFGILLNTEAHYYSVCPPGLETLMYDFSLNVGDTINHFCTIPEGCGEVNIYSTGQSNVFGIYTRWFEVAGGCSWGDLYEGIGSNYGLWEAMFTPVKSRYVWNVFLEYYCPDADCPFIVGTKVLEIESEIRAYPNPIFDNITIDLSQVNLLESFQIELLTIQGELLELITPKTKVFNLTFYNYKSGIYFLRISDGKTQLVKKVVK
jgi:hypothetical protein